MAWLVIDFFVTGVGCWAIIAYADGKFNIPIIIKLIISLLFGLLGMCMNFNPCYKVERNVLQKPKIHAS